MFRMCRLRRLALPFEPMALTTLDTLEGKLANASAHALHSTSNSGPHLAALQDSFQWFQREWSRGAPFFISPKHDGIRMVSYVPSSTGLSNKAKAGSCLNGERQHAKKVKGAAPTATATMTTTYSRHGRVLYGMFWVEKELALLRALAMDPCIVLDGELYIHRSAGTAAAARKPSRKTRAGKQVRKQEQGTSAAGDGFKTGFLAVSALVHRLRGSSSQCATVADIMQYVATLPCYCVFDVAAYNPRGPTLVMTSEPIAEEVHLYGRAVAAELARVRAEVFDGMGGLRDLSCFRCTPNITPFSQRLRTLHVLVGLLARAVTSPELQRAFGVRDRAEVAAAGATMHPPYRGGVFVKMIPYEAVTSLETAKTRLLAALEQQGYEGAVIRTPTNTYALREKRKGVVRTLVMPMVERLATEASSSREGTRHKSKLARGAEAIVVSGKGKKRRHRVTTAANSFVSDSPFCVSADAVANMTGSTITDDDDTAAIAQLALDAAKKQPRRSDTAVKLLPFKDKEYPVLRPLLKVPSTNPRTRPLLTVPLSTFFPDTSRTYIKRDPVAKANQVIPASDGKKAGKGCNSGEEMVVVYGLQCLAENGKVFNVTMPKLSMQQQRELLGHLLSSGTPRKGSKGGKAARSEHRGKSLTGTYVTVKFPSLTEHGVPRFAQVKAIRGGKGWHM